MLKWTTLAEMFWTSNGLENTVFFFRAKKNCEREMTEFT